MIVDFHTHIFPEKIAEKTISMLAEKGGTTPYSNGMESGLLESMKKAGVDISVILPVVTATRQFDSINRFALEINEREWKGRRLISFGGIHPESENYKEELRFIASHGFKGIKLHPDYQGIFIDDIRCKRVISYASELGLAVVTHAGFDGAFPDTTHCTPKKTLEVLREVRPEKMILAHMGGLKFWDEVEEYLVGENVYFDTAYSIDEMPKEQFERIIRNHGCDKILFATDSPWKPQDKYVNEMLSFCRKMTDINQNIEDMIMGANALAIIDK